MINTKTYECFEINSTSTAFQRSMTLATRVRHERHECDTSATRTTRVRHECYTNDASATRAKKFDFDSGTSKNIFLQLYTYYMASEKPQGEEQFL